MNRNSSTVAVATLAATVLTLSACSSSNKKEADTPSVVARTFCDSSLSPTASKSFVKYFTGKHLTESSSAVGLKDTASQLKKDPSHHAAQNDVKTCGVITTGSSGRGMDIEFGWAYGLVPPPKSEPKTAFFSIGDQAYSNGQSTYVLLKCTPPLKNLSPGKTHFLLAHLSEYDSALPLAERQKLQTSILYPIVHKMVSLIGCKETPDLPESPALATVSPSASEK